MHACDWANTNDPPEDWETHVNSSMGWLKLSQVNCFEPWSPNIRHTFRSLGLDGD